MEKLNLGCGFKKKEGFINVDVFPGCEPDRVLDLSVTPWPWAESSIDEAHLDYSLEQIGNTPQDLIRVLQELYRVCAHDAKVKVKFVHPMHDRFTLNPLCVHRLGPQFFGCLSFAANMQQIGQGEYDSSFAMMWKVNFKMERTQFVIGGPWEQAIKQGHLTEEQLRMKMNFERNICEFVEIDLCVEKPKQEA